MTAAPRREVTDLLVGWSRGDASALDRLVPVVYDELRVLARSYLKRERPDHTVHTGTLVHEALMRLMQGRKVDWQSRAHFFGIAARLMRQILVDHARARGAAKRDASECLPARTLAAAVHTLDVDVIALDTALDRLSSIDPEQARLVELRFFGGLTVEETARVMKVSTGTVKREWAMARAWLRRALGPDPRR